MDPWESTRKMDTKTIANTTRAADMEQRQRWLGEWMSAASSLPVSFLYGGRPISGIPQAWNPAMHRRRIDASIVETVFEGSDPGSGLAARVEVTRYLDYPVVEWVAWLENRGDQRSPLIEGLLALDGAFEGDSPTLEHCNGDFYSAEGYTPLETALQPGETLRLAPNGGRPCDGAFPYFRLRFTGGGLTLAVGWPGQWAASFSASDGGVQVRAGQEKTHLRLAPGEKIRTPRMTALAWSGDRARAVNLWRRWYLAHILPRPEGQPLRPRLACAATDTGEEFTNANEENQIRYMERFKQAGIDFDVWWIDAGWYPCRDENGDRRWWRTGTWRPDPQRFPRGLGEVSRNAARLGADLLLWFEPERAYAGSQLDVEHPQWLLKTLPQPGTAADPLRLVDLGNPLCRQWMTDHLCRLVAENGVKIYRQDFNFPPLSYWRDNDPPDRQGLHENLHVQGYLQMWDDLLERNPGLWIDSCASGGRRNDLETLRRSVPLHYSDYGYGDHAAKLAFHHTLYAWIPYFKDSTLAWDTLQPEEEQRFDQQVDTFAFQCGMAPMLFPTLDIRRADYDFASAARMIAVWRAAAETILHGDYYPLTPFSRRADQWAVFQFDQPEAGLGLIQGFRLAQCPVESISVMPQGISTTGLYRFDNPETQERREIPGAALAREGFSFTLPKRSAALWLYRVQEPG